MKSFDSLIVKIIRKICLFTFFSVAGLCCVFLMMTGWFYITCPVYSFEEPKPFSGHQFYNPYQNIHANAWMKCVFHLHTKSWMGLSNGENTSEEVRDVYRQLNYDLIAISDYMRINRFETPEIPFIPTFEHGYNIKKVHQLALGADRVVWRDYFFKQNLHHKQHIIDLLKKNSLLVAVNHPSMRSSYLPENFIYLSGYDLFEVQNGTHISEAAWDAALSSGYPAWLIANDDAHTVNNPARVQREVTFVNVPAPGRDEILNRLAQGVSFGVHCPRKKQSTMEKKMKESESFSFPLTIQVYEDTLRVVWQQTMQHIEFIGDNGNVLESVKNSDFAIYAIHPEDSYIRVKLTSADDVVYYLNPVIRYAGDEPFLQRVSHIDRNKTFQKRLFFSVIIFSVIVVFTLYLRYLRASC